MSLDPIKQNDPFRTSLSGACSFAVREGSKPQVRFFPKPQVYELKGGVEGGLHYQKHRYSKKPVGIGSKTVRLSSGAPVMVRAKPPISIENCLPSLSELCKWTRRAETIQGGEYPENYEEYIYRSAWKNEYQKLIESTRVLDAIIKLPLEERVQKIEEMVTKGKDAVYCLPGISKCYEQSVLEAVSLLCTFRNRYIFALNKFFLSPESLTKGGAASSSSASSRCNSDAFMFAAALDDFIIDIENELKVVEKMVLDRETLLNYPGYHECAAIHDVFVAVGEKREAGFFERSVRSGCSVTLSDAVGQYLDELAMRDTAHAKAVKLFIANTRGQYLYDYVDSGAFTESANSLRVHLEDLEKSACLAEIQKQVKALIETGTKRVWTSGMLCTESVIGSRQDIANQFDTYLRECQKRGGVISAQANDILTKSKGLNQTALNYARVWLPTVIRNAENYPLTSFLTPGHCALSSVAAGDSEKPKLPGCMLAAALLRSVKLSSSLTTLEDTNVKWGRDLVQGMTASGKLTKRYFTTVDQEIKTALITMVNDSIETEGISILEKQLQCSFTRLAKTLTVFVDEQYAIVDYLMSTCPCLCEDDFSGDYVDISQFFLKYDQWKSHLF